MLSLRLLGPPRLERAGAPLNVARRKSRAVLYYLAGHDQPLPRERLLSVFWPDLERPAALQTLRTTLHGLRRALGDDLRVDDERAGLGPAVDVDARRFARALGAPSAAADLSPAGLTASLDLYRGDFLEGFSQPDAAAFEDWAAVERERYRRLAVRGLAALAARREAEGAFSPALDALERALAFDPLQEDLQRAALRLHYLAGDRAAAIRRYDSLRRMLDEELGVLPMAETRRLYDAIVTGALPEAAALSPPQRELPLGRGLGWSSPPAQAPGVSGEHRRSHALGVSPASLPFVGRERELALLRALAAPPSGAAALIEGEPGIGKTRLAEEFLAAAGLLALRGAAREQEQALPYQPLSEALRGLLAHPDWPGLEATACAALPPVWLAEVSRLLPELHPSAPPAAPPDEPRLWEGVYQFLLALARQRPLGLFLDDLQWTDAATLALLGYLIRRARAGAAPLVFILATRPLSPASPAAALAQSLTRQDNLLRLGLARLGREEIETLAARWLRAYGAEGEAAAPLADWLERASEGNPYVLAELLRYLRDHGLVAPGRGPDPAALGGSPVVPQSIYALIQSRLAALSDPARRIVDAAVAAGREFEFEVVYRAAGLSETAALDALDELRAAGLLRPVLPGPGPEAEGSGASARFAFDHSLTMEVAYREVGEPRHRLMHRRVAEALEQLYGRGRLDAVAGLLAYNFAEGNALERAAPYAWRAGRLAAGLAAWAEAVNFFELALRGESDEGRRLEVLMALGQALFRAGSAERATGALRRAVELAEARGDAQQQAAAQLELARALLPHARFGEAVQLLRDLVARAASPAVAAAAEYNWGAALSLEGANLDGAAAHLQTAEALTRAALALGERVPAPLAQLTFERGSVLAQQGDLPGAIALYREALAAASASPEADAATFGVLAHNNLAYHLHLLDPADPAAREHAETGLRQAQEQGLLVLLPYLHSTLGEIELAAGRLDAAQAQFEEGLALAERLTMPERIAGLTANLGRLAAQRGDDALAVRRLSAALAQADALGTLHLAAQIRLWLAPLLPPAGARARLAEARALAESGGRRRLLAALDDLERSLA
jgi:DNA-binding SARP family transcriptional activator